MSKPSKTTEINLKASNFGLCHERQMGSILYECNEQKRLANLTFFYIGLGEGGIQTKAGWKYQIFFTGFIL